MPLKTSCCPRFESSRTDISGPTTDNRQPTTDYRQPTTDSRLPTTDSRQPTTDYRLPTTLDDDIPRRRERHARYHHQRRPAHSLIAI